MEPHHLKVKVGPHEFEAKGTAEEVNQQFSLWKELIQQSTPVLQPALPVQPVAAPATIAEASTTVAASPERGVDLAVPDIFSVDHKKRMVSLKIHPPGESRDADAGLLLIYAFKRILGVDEVLAGHLKDSLERSGIRVDRVDRTIGTYHHSGLLMKSGFGKGGKYHLTMTGLERAERVAKELAGQLA